MLEADFYLDLPDTEEVRKPSLFDRLTAPLAGGRQVKRRVLDMAPEALVDGVARSLAHKGVGNVLTAVANHELAYLDQAGDHSDLDAAKGAILRRLAPERSAFQHLRMLLDHHVDDLHVLVDVEVRSPVPKGTEELHVHLSAKIDDLQARRGETARAYADRVRLFAADEAALESHRLRVDLLTQDLAASFGTTLGGLRPRVEPAWIRVVQVQIAQMGAFRDLQWREDVVEPRYRPVPKFMERGVFSDPFIYFYWDPYHDYLNWNLLDAMLHEGALRSRHVRVVEAGGTFLFSGEQAASRGRHSTGTMETVSWDPSGNLRIGGQVPVPMRSGDPFGAPVDWDPDRGRS